MRPVSTAVAASVLLAFWAATAAAQTAPAARWLRYGDAREVQLRDVAAVVHVRTEDRDDIALSVTARGPLAAPEVRLNGDRLVIDGGLRRQVRGCSMNGDSFEVQIARRGRLAAGQLPVIELRVPRRVVLGASGGVRLQIGPSESAELALDGCGDADVERIAGEADIAVSGSQDVRVYEAGEAAVSIAGSGDVVLGVVRSGLTLSVAGSGDVVAARADGATNIAVQGSGDVLIRDGRATTLTIAIAGSGDVTHNGAAQRLDAVVLGSGDVRVRRVDGEINRRVIGGGEVVVGD